MPGRRKTTTRHVIELTERIVADTHGPHQVRLPARSSLYRLVKALADPAEPPGSPARTATAAGRTGGPPAALRPAEAGAGGHRPPVSRVVGEDGTGVKVAATAALDEASGCVLAAVLHPEQDGPAQLSVPLAEMAVPRPLRPGWPALLEQAHADGPVRRLMSLPDRIEATGSRPAAVPETLILGHGTAGITSAPDRVREPRHQPGAGPARDGGRPPRCAAHASGARRPVLPARGGARPPATAGENRADVADWSMPQLQDLLDEWITGVWHPRPQEQLRHPLLPRAGLAAGDVAGAAGRGQEDTAAAGRADSRRTAAGPPVCGDRTGILLGGCHYDDACLDEHRGRGNRFEVHHPTTRGRFSSGCPTASSTRCRGRRASMPGGPSTSCCGAVPAPSSYIAPPVPARARM